MVSGRLPSDDFLFMRRIISCQARAWCRQMENEVGEKRLFLSRPPFFLSWPLRGKSSCQVVALVAVALINYDKVI